MLPNRFSDKASELLQEAIRRNPAVKSTALYYLAFLEQARGKGVDHRTDIFSMGVMLFQMATGRLPFEGGSDVDAPHDQS